MAIPRTLGPVLQTRVQQLRRQAAVAVSEITGATTAAGAFPRYIDVVRREPTGTANTAVGLSTTWTTVAGLTGLVGHVRTFGRWLDEVTATEVELKTTERSVLITDIPAAGDGAAGDLLLTDRLRFADQTYGLSIWDIKQVRVRKPDGIVWALVELAREEGVSVPT